MKPLSPSRASQLEDLSRLVKEDCVPQPSDSQQVMPIEDMFAAFKVGRWTLTKSAAWALLESMGAYLLYQIHTVSNRSSTK
jgi:hypothetical protein